MPRFFLSNVLIIGDSGAKTVIIRNSTETLTNTLTNCNICNSYGCNHTSSDRHDHPNVHNFQKSVTDVTKKKTFDTLRLLEELRTKKKNMFQEDNREEEDGKKETVEV